MSYRPSVIVAILAILATPASAGNIIDPYTLFPPTGGGSIAYEGNGTLTSLTQGNGTNPITLAKPSGLAAGGLAVAFLSISYSTTVSGPASGWTYEGGRTDGWSGHKMYIYSRQITDPGSETDAAFPTTGTGAMKGVIVWMSNASSIDDVQCNSSENSPTTTPTTPNVTPTASSGLILSAAGWGANSSGAITVTAIPGDDRVTSSAADGAEAWLGIGSTPSSGTSPQGSGSFTTSNTQYVTCSVAAS